MPSARFCPVSCLLLACHMPLKRFNLKTAVDRSITGGAIYPGFCASGAALARLSRAGNQRDDGVVRRFCLGAGAVHSASLGDAAAGNGTRRYDRDVHHGQGAAARCAAGHGVSCHAAGRRAAAGRAHVPVALSGVGMNAKAAAPGAMTVSAARSVCWPNRCSLRACLRLLLG